jgi:uncharacterized protein RhaS with RHS repeats
MQEITYPLGLGNMTEKRLKQYYYHSDHLGSAQVISNASGEEYERIEYTPYGELWIGERRGASRHMRTPNHIAIP